MSYKIIASPFFEKNIKKLKKKYPQIKFDVSNLVKKLYENPKLGIPLGNNLFKIRIPNSSIPIGKSGGFRVVTYYLIDDTIYLITIYSKSDLENITKEEIDEIMKELEIEN